MHVYKEIRKTAYFVKIANESCVILQALTLNVFLSSWKNNYNVTPIQSPRTSVVKSQIY